MKTRFFSTLVTTCLFATPLLAVDNACPLGDDPQETIENLKYCSIKELENLFLSLENGPMPHGGQTGGGFSRACRLNECKDSDPLAVAFYKGADLIWRSMTFYGDENGGPIENNWVGGLSFLRGTAAYETFPPDKKEAIRIRYNQPILGRVTDFIRELHPNVYFAMSTSRDNFSPVGFFVLDFTENKD
ncbi:uncharacterized protein VTP21DRAFT_8325 [Calcarisporiella thermophila]|uniref:uncharacterized protein n=1 Tax=Calcarisporiella thermophila TaxID=911321 RepID=UPI0037436854